MSSVGLFWLGFLFFDYLWEGGLECNFKDMQVIELEPKTY